jgi:probable phosphoglycerate mutase
MLEIVLIRPGATDYDKYGRIQGTLDIPLNSEGNREVARQIGQLRDRGIEVLYCSDSQPAIDTAEAIAQALGIRLKKLENMQNLDHGLWQGMLVEEIKRKHPKIYRQWQEQPESICPPDGEMLSSVHQRASICLRRLLKKHKSGVIGLVLPEPLASVVKVLLDHQELSDLWKASSDHGNWETVVVEPAELTLAS